MSPLPPAKTWIEVSASALQANVRAAQAVAKDTAVIPTVKANAYGHGLSLVMRALARENVPFFAVDSVEEARVIREISARIPVLLLGYIPRHQLQEVVQSGWSFVCSKREMLMWLTEVATARHPAKVHLEVETGLYRQGADTQELEAMLAFLEQQTEGFIVEGVCSHFASAENVEDQRSVEVQEARFIAACSRVQSAGHTPRWRHIACSAALWLRVASRFDAVRLGISLYGIWSSAGVANRAQSLYPDLALMLPLTWKTLVAEVKTVPAGTAVGYGASEYVQRDTKLAVLPIGYADGFDRRLSSCGEVLIHGERARVVGRVCMNMCMVDVTDIAQVQVEDEVVVLGKQGTEVVSPADVETRQANFIAYEAVARLRADIPRILVA